MLSPKHAQIKHLAFWSSPLFRIRVHREAEIMQKFPTLGVLLAPQTYSPVPRGQIIVVHHLSICPFPLEWTNGVQLCQMQQKHTIVVIFGLREIIEIQLILNHDASVRFLSHLSCCRLHRLCQQNFIRRMRVEVPREVRSGKEHDLLHIKRGNGDSTCSNPSGSATAPSYTERAASAASPRAAGMRRTPRHTLK